MLHVPELVIRAMEAMLGTYRNDETEIGSASRRVSQEGQWRFKEKKKIILKKIEILHFVFIFCKTGFDT